MEDKEFGVYRFQYPTYYGSFNGIFTARHEDIQKAYGQDAYFGDELGKHSDVSVTLTPENLKLVTKREAAVISFAQNGFTTGYNPLEWIEDIEDEEDIEWLEDVT